MHFTDISASVELLGTAVVLSVISNMGFTDIYCGVVLTLYVFLGFKVSLSL